MKRCAVGHKTYNSAEFCHRCGIGIVDMNLRKMAKEMEKPKKKARKVKARLSQKAAGRIKGLTKQAGGFLDDVPINSKTFEDHDSHKAAAKLTDVLLDVLQTLRVLVEDPAEAEIFDDVEQVLEQHAPVEPDELNQDVEEIDLEEEDEVEVEEPEEELEPQTEVY